MGVGGSERKSNWDDRGTADPQHRRWVYQTPKEHAGGGPGTAEAAQAHPHSVLEHC